MKVTEGMTMKGAMLLVLLHLGGEVGEIFTSNKIKEYEGSGRWPNVDEIKKIVENQFKVTELEAKAIK